jgi:hypothetical protein
MSGGISHDVINGLRELLAAVFLNGQGISQSYPLTGNGVDTKILENTDLIIPRITIINNSTNPVKIGYQRAVITLNAGASHLNRAHILNIPLVTILYRTFFALNRISIFIILFYALRYFLLLVLGYERSTLSDRILNIYCSHTLSGFSYFGLLVG